MSITNNRRRGNGNGSGNRRGNNKSSGTNNNKKKKSSERVIKFAPYSNNTKGSFTTFDTVKEAAIAEVSKTVTQHSEDIIRALETKEHIDFDDASYKPKKRKSTKADKDAQKEEQAELDQIYGFKIKSWISRQDIYSSNKRKAYDIIYSYCTMTLKE